MKSYELTYIITPNISAEEAGKIQNDVAALIQGKEGVIVKSDKIGAQPLAYPIKKHASGYFQIETFQIEEAKIKEIKASLDTNLSVLRSFVLIKKPSKPVKERRMRRMAEVAAMDSGKKPFTTEPVAKKQDDKPVDSADLDKKLDEILS